MRGWRLSRQAGILTAGALVLGGIAAGSASARPTGATGAAPAAHGGSAAGCVLTGHAGRAIRHVIYLQFDNTHYTRDNPNVPSDLQQMPDLLHFITGQGTLISHEHTPLIAHTADDIVTSETGLYGSGHGVPIANEYHYYKPDGVTDEAGSFSYWTDPIVDYYTGLAGRPVGDHTPTMIGANGRNAPAPWVPYTRAGCDFGTVAAANTELENTLPDVPVVFGAHSPEAREASNPSSSGQAKAAADFMGLAVHCALGSAVCSAAHGGRPDVLPSEPGGYHGYQALYGNKFVQPAISPGGPVRNLYGQVIKDSNGDVGFPGYDGMVGANALAYTLDMQTHGVPVTFTYLTDLHDSQKTGAGMGSGTASYEQQLKTENAAFGTFFRDLTAHGITKANTLFVITSDEGDHFVGSPASPANCNGVTILCRYSKAGEVDGNLTGMLAAKGVTAPFDVQADSAPSIYVHGQPGRTTIQVRKLEQATARLSALDLATGRTVRLTDYLADPVEMRLLHMITADPKRTPTFTLFANPDFWLSSGAAHCGASCVTEPSGSDAWNHGTVAEQINTTWLGLVGPGVRQLGVDNSVWSDHTDIRPTMLELLGLHDDYAPDGRVLAEVLDPAALPAGMRAHAATLLRLGQVYTQLEAAVGVFGLDTLRASTRALASTSAGDRSYAKIESELQRLGQARDALAGRMRADLLGAAFDGRVLSERQARVLITQGEQLLGRAAVLAQ
ncbi:MAG TPA: hypothetical protein VGS62_10755 [Streptosporangiaceae bacterium]|nr:hypothetical protein [Streptosporangiaceae bacterium]